MKPKILSLVPDRLEKPMGGLGIQYTHIHPYLQENFEVFTVCYPHLTPQFSFPNTKQIYPSFLPDPKEPGNPLIYNLAHQINYFTASLKFQRPDLIHAYDWPCYLVANHLAIYYGVPLVMSLSLSIRGQIQKNLKIVFDDKNFDGLTTQKTLEGLETGMLNCADIIVGVGSFYKDVYPEFRSKIRIIPNGINLDSWIPKSQVSIPLDNGINVLYIGRFAKMKGFDHLMNANIPDGINLIVAGSSEGGDLECVNLLQAKLDSKKKNLFFCGPLYGQKKIELMHSVEAVIMPSVHEPFGIVALEAFASGAILISSRLDGLGDFVNERNSMLVEPTPEGIEKSLENLLKLKEEEKLKLKIEGRKTCEIFTWKNAGEKMTEVYNELLKSR
jgi:glycosyltransferase involved in cell wall biosynthesis